MKKILLTVLAISALWGCDTKDVSPSGPASLSVKDSIHCDWKGTPRGLFIDTNQDAWIATIDDEYKEWCDFTPRRDSIIVKLAINTSPDTREGKIVIHAGNITDTLLIVQQGGDVPIFEISTDVLNFVWQESTMAVDIITNQLSWSAAFVGATPDWCKLKKVDSQLHVETLNNENPGERTATITITAGNMAPLTVNVTQTPKSGAVSGAIKIEVPKSFDVSKVYAVWNGDKKVAEICSEYVKEISDKQRTVIIYPLINDKPDLKNGFVADNGGKLSWTDAVTPVYTAGESTISAIYITEDGTISASGSSENKATVLPMFFKDFDGYKYSIVKAGGNFFLGENLRTTKFSDGTPIGQNLDSPTGFWWKYEDNKTYVEEACGLLYSWLTSKKIAPEGWHVPSREEWLNLTDYFGTEHSLYLKSEAGWSENGSGNNLSGLTLLPGGSKNTYQNKCFGGIVKTENAGGWYGSFWSTSEDLPEEGDVLLGVSLYVENVKKNISLEKKDKAVGMSIRLIRDI